MKRMTFRHIPRQLFGLTLSFIPLSRVLCLSVLVVMLGGLLEPEAAAQTVSFGAKTDFGTGARSRSVAVGDFNGDGTLDLAVANENSSLGSSYRRGRPPSQTFAGSARKKSAVQFVSQVRLSYEKACSQRAWSRSTLVQRYRTLIRLPLSSSSP
jgi:hypothetical protein